MMYDDLFIMLQIAFHKFPLKFHPFCISLNTLCPIRLCNVICIAQSSRKIALDIARYTSIKSPLCVVICAIYMFALHSLCIMQDTAQRLLNGQLSTVFYASILELVWSEVFGASGVECLRVAARRQLNEIVLSTSVHSACNVYGQKGKGMYAKHLIKWQVLPLNFSSKCSHERSSDLHSEWQTLAVVKLRICVEYVFVCSETFIIS